MKSITFTCSSLLYLFVEVSTVVSAEDRICDVVVSPLPTFTFVEGTEATITFDLISNCSTSSGEGAVRLSKINDKNVPWHQCVVYLPVKNSVVRHRLCDCRALGSAHRIRCEVKRKMDRSDNNYRWTLRSDGNVHIKDTLMIVNVTYQPTIKTFTLGVSANTTTIIVKKGGRDIDIRCNFTKGNPPRSIRITGPRNETLGRSDSNIGTLHTPLHGPDCAHSGRYQCLVDGTGEQQSVVLLVKCSLKFAKSPGERTLDLSPGDNAEISTNVRSYTKENLMCWKTQRILGADPTSGQNCTGYRWAFVGTAGEEKRGHSDDNTPKQKDQPRFTPHIVRLARLLNTRLNRQAPILRITPGRPLLTMGQLRSVADLQPFFNTLCLQQSEKSAATHAKKQSAGQQKAKSASALQVPASGMTKSVSAPEKLESKLEPETQQKTCRQFVEELLERDFLEIVS